MDQREACGPERGRCAVSAPAIVIAIELTILFLSGRPKIATIRGGLRMALGGRPK
ncbi:hypothetical protein [Glycomyces buryatensis]|uniref:hypothetical protein n=1 Tax=Glycomyces buryatensis TaxID=2570927 RepID=UPI00145627A6|nr:hypothetical protein [Glycomyces buryatensis]